MKYLIAILILCSTVSASVRNTGSTTRDSVCIYVTCLDSVGKMSTCDSFYVRVIKSGTNAVAFSDSGTLAMTGMDSISGKSEYYYHRAVADIDGSGADGEYILSVIAKKTAGSGWPTPNTRIFEIANNLVHDSLILKRLGVYNTTASTTTNDYGAVEFSSTGDSSFAFVVKNTGIAGAKFKGSAFKLYSKTHSGILSIGGATGSPTSGGVYFLDSSANGYGQYVRSTSSGYGATYTDDGTSYVTTLGPIGGDIVTDWITATALRREACQKIAQNILKDTTKRIGFKGGLGDSVLTPAPTVAIPAAITDTLNAILDTLQVTDTRWDSLLAVVADANTLMKNRLRRMRDSIDAILDSLQLYDNAGRFPLKQSDTVNMAGQYTKIRDSVSSVERGKYAMGAVWIGPSANTNTVSYVDGIITNPVSTIAAAKTIADNLNLRRFFIVRTGTVQIGANMVGYDFDGTQWSLTTTGGSRDVSSSSFTDALVTGGTYASTTAASYWRECEFATGVSVAAVNMWGCTFAGTLTLTAVGNYDFIDCASVVAGSGTPTFDLGAAVGATNLSFRRWSGGLRLTNIQAGDTISVDAVSGGKIKVYGTGGSINIRGMVAVDDSSGGSVSIVKTQVINRSEIASAARSLILNDTTKTIKFSNDSVVAIDPVRTVTATVPALSAAQDSLNALTAITRADSNLTKAVRDTAHIIDSIVKLILPLATQARDTLLTFPTWLAARFDTMMVAAGWADSSRTTNTYLNDADTVRVYKGENLWFKYIRLHPAHVPGYRPDSTRGRGW